MAEREEDEALEGRELSPTKDINRRRLAAVFIVIVAAIFALLLFAVNDKEQEAAEPKLTTADPEVQVQGYQRARQREEQEAILAARRDSLRQEQAAQRAERLAQRRGGLEAFELAPDPATGADPAQREAELLARLAQAQQQAGAPPAGPTMERRLPRSSSRRQQGQQQQQASPAEQAFALALKASPMVSAGAATDVPEAEEEDPFQGDPVASYLIQRMEEEDRLEEEEQGMNPYDDYFAAMEAHGMGAQAGGAQQGGAAASAGAGSGGGGQSFNERVAEESRQRAYVQAQIVPQLSPFELKAGSVIPAMLITGMNSDLPGDLVAQVTRDVYDSQQQRFLIVPKGTRLLGRYNSDVAFGQDRALVAWTRMVYPDGRSIELPGFNAVDNQGMTGLRDGVDRHLIGAFASAGAIAVLGAGVQLASQSGDDEGGFGSSNTPDPQEVIATQIALEISRVATDLLERNLDRQPTITVRPGFRFSVFVNRDLALPQPYVDPGTAPRFVRSPEAVRMPPPPGPRSNAVQPGGQRRAPQPGGRAAAPADGVPADPVPGGRTLVRKPAPAGLPGAVQRRAGAPGTSPSGR